MWLYLLTGLLILVWYLLYLVISAWSEVKDAPRVPMFICPKHGAVPSKYTMTLNTPILEQPIEMCPMCWEDKMKAAKAGTL